MGEGEPKPRRFLANAFSVISLGVIGSAIWYIFGQPMYVSLAHWLSLSQNQLISETVDRAYATAVSGGLDYIAFRTYAGVVFLYFVVLVVMFFKATGGLIEIRQEFRPQKPLSRETTDKFRDFNRMMVRFYGVDILYFGLATGMGVVLALLMLKLSVGAITAEAKATFERSHMALLPYMSDTEDRLLQGQWARVESKRDYEAVMTRMAKIAADKHAPPLPKREI